MALQVGGVMNQKKQNMVRIPIRQGPKNDFAGESQQQM
jgi:hypothetical protein